MSLCSNRTKDNFFSKSRLFHELIGREICKRKCKNMIRRQLAICTVETMFFSSEINDLRKELKVSRTQVHDLEAALGLHRKATGGGGGGPPRTAPLVMSFPGARGGGGGAGDLLGAQAQFQEERMNEYERMIEMQRAEMRRLRDR